MLDLRQKFDHMFSNNLNDLVTIYQTLSSMNSEERERTVSSFDEFKANVIEQSESKKTKESINYLLQFQYLSRFKYQIYGRDTLYSKTHNAKDKFVRSFEHVCSMAKADDNLFSHFKYNISSLDDFLSTIYQTLYDADIRTQIDFVIGELYGVIIPKTEQTYEDWFQWTDLRDEKWDWEYRKRIDEWNSSWFKKKNTYNEIHSEWAKQKSEISNYLKEVQIIYPYLGESNEWLKNLYERSLYIDLHHYDIHKANNAIREGTKLKHFLLEEGLSLSKNLEAITKDL